MRCPKCQYVGFEPSPRCRNCGYDFAFSGDDLSTMAMTSDAVGRDALAEFDLDILDRATADNAPPPSVGFDLDTLLAQGRSQAAAEFRPSAPRTASAVATPPAEDVLRIVAEERSVSAPVAAAAEPVVMRMEIQVPAAVAIAPPRAPEAPRASASVRQAPAAPVTTELPLFMQVMSEAVAERSAGASPLLGGPADPAMMATPAGEMADVEEIDDRPLVQVPAVLRQPLAVRRNTPDPGRLRTKYARATAKADASVAGDLLQGIDVADGAAAPVSRDEVNVMPTTAPVAPALRMSAEPTPQSLPAGWLQGVSASKRMTAAAVDGVLLGSLNVAIVWFTMSVCGISLSQARSLPLVPVGLFVLLLNTGYLVLFTAACGQTIGKMAAGIRVVGTTTGAVINDRISIGQALVRSVGAIASCVPLGIGFWFSLMGDGRALHDRFAHTRVVRA